MNSEQLTKDNLSMKDYLINQNSSLQIAIDEINKKIKENLENHRQFKKDYFQTHNIYPNLNEENNELYMLQQKIIFYKEATQKLKNQMESIYNVNKIDQLDNDYKLKKEILKKIKVENATLNRIYNNQLKAQKNINFHNDNAVEIGSIVEKVSTLKEEYKQYQNINRTFLSKIRIQNDMSRSLEDKSKRLKEKLELMKKKTQIVEKEDQIFELDMKVHQTELLIKSEEKLLKEEINKQDIKISALKDKITVLVKNLQEKGKDIKLGEIKLKEIKKFNSNAIKNLIPIDKTNIRSFSATKNKKNHINLNNLLKREERNSSKRKLSPLKLKDSNFSDIHIEGSAQHKNEN